MEPVARSPLPKVAARQRLLESDGWYLVRVRGSHYRHPGKPGTATVAGEPKDTLTQ
ncbi:MAG: type II toxin-antitoxin system HicA family toxin [Pseudonocardiaceae bacterium]